MENLQLNELLNTLSLNELKDLKLFIQIPSLGLVKLKIKNQGTLNVLVEEIIEKLLNKQQPRINEIIPNAHHRYKVYQAVSRYLAYLQYKPEGVGVQLPLQIKLIEKGYIQHASKKTNAALTDLDKKSRNFDYHDSKFRFYQTLAILTKGTEDGNENLDKLKLHQYLYFLEVRIRIICEQCLRNRMPGKTYLMDDMELSILEQARSQSDPVISMFCTIFDMIQDPVNSENLFDELFEYLVTEGNSIEKFYRKSFFEYLLNYCIDLIKNGNTTYAQKYLDIVAVLESQHLLLDQKEIRVQRFKNIVTAYSYTNNLEELENFLRIYSKKLPKDRKEKAEQLAVLRLLFVKGDIQAYWKAHEKIEQSQFKSPAEYTEFLRLQMKVVHQLYLNDQCDYEDLEKLENKFRRYLSRRKEDLHADMAERCRNFIVVVMELAAQGDCITEPHDWLFKEEKLFYPNDKLWVLSKYKRVLQ